MDNFEIFMWVMTIFAICTVGVYVQLCYHKLCDITVFLYRIDNATHAHMIDYQQEHRKY